MKWADFDGPELPSNRAGDTYPSQYQSEGGRAIVSLDPNDAVLGNSVRFEVARDVYTRLQFVLRGRHPRLCTSTPPKPSDGNSTSTIDSASG